jgi:hypothetical protein
MNLSRVPLTVAALAASLALTASPALAKGGSGGGGSAGGGGGTPAPAPAPTPAPDPGGYPLDQCPVEIQGGTQTLADGTNLFANGISGVGCVIVHNQLNGVLTLSSVVVAPGWNYSVQSAGGGSSSKVDVQFTNVAGDRHEITVQPGKTVIR